MARIRTLKRQGRLPADDNKWIAWGFTEGEAYQLRNITYAGIEARDYLKYLKNRRTSIKNNIFKWHRQEVLDGKYNEILKLYVAREYKRCGLTYSEPDSHGEPFWSYFYYWKYRKSSKADKEADKTKAGYPRHQAVNRPKGKDNRVLKANPKDTLLQRIKAKQNVLNTPNIGEGLYNITQRELNELEDIRKREGW
jgi:hypothetical protein